jgi:hypothetical protein
MVKLKDKEPTVEIMWITPAMAANWLERCHPRNRMPRKGKVHEFSEEQKAGRWWLSDQCITFDVDENNINGRTRLTACVRSGVPFQAIVARNWPRESIIVLDQGTRRSTDDNFKILGRDYPFHCGATVRRLLSGWRFGFEKTYSDQVIDEFMQRHGQSVAFAHRVAPAGKGRFSSASIRAVIARAHICRRGRSRLERFGEVLTGDDAAKGDEGAVVLRNYIARRRSGHSGGDRQRLYRYTEGALDAFLNLERIGQLRMAEAELFPIRSLDEWAGSRKPASNGNGKPTNGVYAHNRVAALLNGHAS